MSARYRRLRWASDVGERMRELECDALDAWPSYEENDWRVQEWWRGSPFEDALSAGVRRMHEVGFTHRLPLPDASRASALGSVETSLVREGLEARLVGHLAALMLEPQAWPLRTLEADGEDRALGRLAERLSGSHAAAMAALLLVRPFWLRPLERWSGRSIESLVEHLLVAFPVPRFLLSAWSVQIDDEAMRAMAWLIVLGQGGSLARFGELAHARMPELWARVPSKLPHALMRVPDSLQPRAGIVCAELLRLGAGAREFELLRADPSFMLDFTGPLEPGELEFWRTTAAWLLRHRDAPDTDMPAILTWARHEQTERARRGGAFEWRGRTWTSAQRDALAYQASLARPWLRHLSWKARGWDWEGEHEGATWTIRELNSSAALRAESQAMSHCVQRYDLACWRGDAAIFSVCREGQRCVTIEVRPSDRKVVQAKRARNQAPSPAELEVIARWSAGVKSSHSNR